MGQMGPMVRRVLARWMEDPQDEQYFGDKKDWMTYLEDKSDPLKGKHPGTAVDMLEETDELGQPFSQYNPYDYQAPSNKPKSLKDGPPFINKVPHEIDFPLFMLPTHMLEKHPSLKYWYDARREDWTTDEEEQRPAISLTRKYAQMDSVVAHHLMRHMPVIVPLSYLDTDVGISKEAASMKEILNSDYHYKRNLKRERAGGCEVTWSNKNKESQLNKGFFSFRVRCPGSKSGAHTVMLQFLRSEEEKEAPQGYENYDVQLACTCPSFLFYGAQFYAVQGNYMYMPLFRPDLTAPRTPTQYTVHVSPRYPQGKRHPGRGLNFRVCKHILAVYEKFVRRARIKVPYADYPISGPPSKIINKDVWKKLMGFDFTEENIKQRIRQGKVPKYFEREKVVSGIIDWFNNVWMPRSETQKLKALKGMVEYPERIFFILLKESFLQRKRGKYISNRLIEEGYELMKNTIRPESELEPEQKEVEETGVKEQIGKGVGISPPGGKIPASEFIKTTPQATKPVKSPSEEGK